MLQTPESAEKLLDQLSPYLLEAHTQVFAPSPFLRDIEPSPWEALTYGLSSAVLAIGINHPFLRDAVQDKAAYYLEQCLLAVTSLPASQAQADRNEVSGNEEEVLNVATITVSILGFLEAAASHANFWSASERLHAIGQVKKILSESFLVSVETAFSTIRNSHGPNRALKDWRRYTRHYAAIGQPLGAMVLQRGFLRFIVSSSSLLLADAASLRGTDVLDVLMSGEERAEHAPSLREGVVLPTVETLTEFLLEEMSLLEDGADFLQLGSAWQQRLAFAVKASVLTAFLNCVMLEDDVADADILMSWLDDTMADPVQMSDDTLACAVLKCTAILARTSNAFSSNTSRSLPRFIVQGGLRGATVSVAANCLAYVLQSLSQDAVITTLYTLGNVLSSGTTGERVVNGGATPNGSLKAHRHISQHNNQTTGSAISLSFSGDEETSAVYGNVVQAIVGVARSCNDDKITALAQSMLVQKIGKISLAVDARIISEAAVLAVIGGAFELKSVLRLYSRLGHDGVSQESPVIARAVS